MGCIFHQVRRPEVRRHRYSNATNFEENTVHFGQHKIIMLDQSIPGRRMLQASTYGAQTMTRAALMPTVDQKRPFFKKKPMKTLLEKWLGPGTFNPVLFCHCCDYIAGAANSRTGARAIRFNAV